MPYSGLEKEGVEIPIFLVLVENLSMAFRGHILHYKYFTSGFFCNPSKAKTTNVQESGLKLDSAN